MELENRYENLLVAIHNAESERFLQSEILQQEKLAKTDVQKLLKGLIELDLVEFDKQEDAYYLTYEGYEKVAKIQEMKKLDTNINPGSSSFQKKKKKHQFPLILLGLFLPIAGYFALNGILINTNVKNGLDEEVLKKVKQEVETMMDSIIQEKQNTE